MARIIVVGASLGGLLAANMLLRDGHDVRVLEKAEGSLDGRGAGIVTHTALSVALRRCGVQLFDTSSDETLGVKVQTRVALDAHGAEITRLDMPQVLTSWSRLYALLRRSFPTDRIHGGVTVTSFSQGPGSVQVSAHLADNGPCQFESDLLIASDGLRSAVRAQLAPLAVPEYAGYIAWRGVCDEAALSAHTLQSVFPYFAFGLPHGEQLIGYPVAGKDNITATGQRRWNFVWYRPAAATELQDLLTDDDGIHHPLGIAPQRIRACHITAMLEAAQGLLAPQFAEIIARTAQPFVQPIFDMASERLAFDRVALIGDAAFVARPHVGMGVTKAAEDAMALSDRIRAHGATAQALTAFESQRLPAGKAVVERARRLGSYLAAQAHSARVPRDPAAVLRETAVDWTSLPKGTQTHRNEALAH